MSVPAKITRGDVLAGLRAMPDESVQCVVTSPPYWGLRNYGSEGQIGLEPTLEAYIERLVEVFREVRRVLRSDGTLWLNMGDCYVAAPPGNDRPDHSGSEFTGTRGTQPFTGAARRASRVGVSGNKGNGAADVGDVAARVGRSSFRRDRRPREDDQHKAVPALKEKDLVGMPWRLAFALQADGWYLRSDIIWSKPNPMPESVRDRPTKAHEYVFLLSKSRRYYYDGDAIREPLKSGPSDLKKMAEGKDRISAKHLELDDPHLAASATTNIGKKRSVAPRGGISAPGYEARKWEDRSDGMSRPPMTMTNREYNPGGRNARSVWDIATQPYRGAHFATFPEELARRCIEAGSSAGGMCQECGAPRARILSDPKAVEGRGSGNVERKLAGEEENGRTSIHMGSSVPWQPTAQDTVGWKPTCAHEAPTIPCTVLDPFAGSGTTLAVAVSHGRRGRGIELSAEYCELARQRIGPVLCEVANVE